MTYFRTRHVGDARTCQTLLATWKMFKNSYLIFLPSGRRFFRCVFLYAVCDTKRGSSPKAPGWSTDMKRNMYVRKRSSCGVNALCKDDYFTRIICEEGKNEQIGNVSTFTYTQCHAYKSQIRMVTFRLFQHRLLRSLYHVGDSKKKLICYQDPMQGLKLPLFD